MTRRVEEENARRASRRKKRALVCRVIATIAFAVFTLYALLFFGGIVFSNYLNSDTRHSTLLTASGTVTSVLAEGTGRDGGNPICLVTIDWGKNEAMWHTSQDFRVGQQVSVDYEVGKSGTIYILKAN